MDRFEVGEVAINQNCVYHPECNETECTVIGGLELRNCRREGWVMTYLTRDSDGKTFAAKPYQLRKLPRKQATVEWEDTIFMPQGLQHEHDKNHCTD